ARLTANANGGITPEAPRPVPATQANAKAPGTVAVDYLSEKQPLITPEWAAWKAAMRAPRLAGTWLISAYEPGKGRVFGQMTITPGATDDVFNTATQLTYASSGATVKATGKSIAYTGYSWRGRESSATPSVLPKTEPAAPVPTSSAMPAEWKEAM